MKYYRFGHMSVNLVRKGDKVKKGQKIGTVGDGNSKTSSNKMYAHLHFDISKKEIKEDYDIGSKSKVENEYINPYTDAKEEGYKFADITESDHIGYDWLSWNGYGYHPGVDLNGKGSGNADFGNPIYSPVDGVVTHEVRTWFANKGWGNIIVIKKEEKPVCNKCCEIHCPK